MNIVGMTRPPKDPHERQFLRALGAARQYGGLWFIEVPDSSDPVVRDLCGLLADQFTDDEQGYLRWLHTPRSEFRGECPHELLATGRPQPVLDFMKQGDTSAIDRSPE